MVMQYLKLLLPPCAHGENTRGFFFGFEYYYSSLEPHRMTRDASTVAVRQFTKGCYG